MQDFTFVNQTKNGAWSAGTPGTDVTAILSRIEEYTISGKMVDSMHWKLQMAWRVHK